MKYHVAFDKVLAAARKTMRQERVPKQRHDMAEAISKAKEFVEEHGEFIRNCDTEE